MHPLVLGFPKVPFFRFCDWLLGKSPVRCLLVVRVQQLGRLVCDSFETQSLFWFKNGSRLLKIVPAKVFAAGCFAFSSFLRKCEMPYFSTLSQRSYLRLFSFLFCSGDVLGFFVR